MIRKHGVLLEFSFVLGLRNKSQNNTFYLLSSSFFFRYSVDITISIIRPKYELCDSSLIANCLDHLRDYLQVL